MTGAQSTVLAADTQGFVVAGRLDFLRRTVLNAFRGRCPAGACASGRSNLCASRHGCRLRNKHKVAADL
eukprot:scaffold265369_cov22-Tisochrysis_lutea.AAC.1